MIGCPNLWFWGVRADRGSKSSETSNAQDSQYFPRHVSESPCLLLLSPVSSSPSFSGHGGQLGYPARFAGPGMCYIIVCLGTWWWGTVFTPIFQPWALFLCFAIFKNFTFVNSFLCLFGELGPHFVVGPLSPPPAPIVCVPSLLPF